MRSRLFHHAGQCLAALAIMTGVALALVPVANADLNSLLACIYEGKKMVASCCIDEGGAYSFDPATGHTCTLQPAASNEAPATITLPVPTAPKVVPPPLENPNHPKPGTTVPGVPTAPRA